MAPPQLFINTKILELEKQPKNEKEDGSEDFESEDKQESGKKDKEKENNNDNDPVEDADGSDENRIARSLPILTYVVSPLLVFTGLAIAIVGAFLWEDKSVYPYFFVLGLHLSSLAIFYIVQDPGTTFGKLLCSYAHAYARWDSQRQHIIIGAILSVANIIFTAMELLFLFDQWNDCYYYSGNRICYVLSSSLRASCLICSICLALPWPLLLLWPTNSCIKTFQFQETLGKHTNMLQKKQVQVNEQV